MPRASTEFEFGAKSNPARSGPDHEPNLDYPQPELRALAVEADQDYPVPVDPRRPQGPSLRGQCGNLSSFTSVTVEPFEFDENLPTTRS